MIRSHGLKRTLVADEETRVLLQTEMRVRVAVVSRLVLRYFHAHAQARHDGDVMRFYEQLKASEKIPPGAMHALMLLAMSATYDPDPQAPLGVRLPVDPHTCRLIDERWERWLADS